MTDKLVGELNSGSVWNRWEPHVHTPDTLLNNQFAGDDAWEQYLQTIEKSVPPIRAIGVTDYYFTENYEYVRQQWENGRIQNVDLIFPNVELRLNVGTNRGRFVNIHLLVSPEDPDHINQLHRLLSRLQFRAYNEIFSCTQSDLIRLGRVSDPKIIDEKAALRHGAIQFKTDFEQLRTAFDNSAWAKENILIAIAGGQTDGTSGVREAANATLRKEMETFAHVIFASSSAQREFWLGLREVKEEQLKANYGGLKPCLHGSDAHENSTVGTPVDDRFSWIKGSLEFDALRQACIDPSGRAFVGPNPPMPSTQSQLISTIEITGAKWASTPKIALNSGLVAIIGARGSGKTALADVIAMACDAIPSAFHNGDDWRPSSSFVSRAHDLLGGAGVKITWRTGDSTVRSLDGTSTPSVTYPRARYLSQQFVEELCSATGLTDELLREIERVIFESHTLVNQDGALNFDELLEMRASRFRQAREREEDALVQLSDRIGTELEKDRQVADLKGEVLQKQQLVAAYTADRSKLVPKGSDDKMKRLTELSVAAETVRSYIRYFNNQEQALLALQDEVSDLRNNQAPELLRRSKVKHAASQMKPEEWKPFLIDYTGNVDVQLNSFIAQSKQNASIWKGVNVPTNTPPIGETVDLIKLPLTNLEFEIQRIQKLVSADILVQRQFSALTEKIVSESVALEKLNEKLVDAQGAKERAIALIQDRESAYERVFEAIVAEQNVLIQLYEPLMKRLAANSGTLKKLNFTVSRTANTKSWSEIAENELLDLRRTSPFKGTGTLHTKTDESLKNAWENGSPKEVTEAMAKFREFYQSDLLEHAKVSKVNIADYRSWLKRFAQWLYSTNHIELHYGIDFDGVDIRKLSPGTRGVVLLLLYLALDDADDRPLIIDQPEENLDPKSVFDELVGLFIAAKLKRQVIMVTHNANLVINTDADQIIVANADHQERGEIPHLTYTSGGLENSAIRKAVCDILEGGEEAFKERARRLRVKFDR